VAEVDEPFAFCVKSEKQQNPCAHPFPYRSRAADQFVVLFPVIGHPHRTDNSDDDPSTSAKTSAEHDGIERISVEPYAGGDRSVVKRAGHRRNVLNPPAGVSFYEAASRNLYDDFDFGQICHTNIPAGSHRHPRLDAGPGTVSMQNQWAIFT